MVFKRKYFKKYFYNLTDASVKIEGYDFAPKYPEEISKMLHTFETENYSKISSWESGDK